MKQELNKKLNKLRNILNEMQSVLVAFSGGVDSSLLLKIAKDVLDENVIAVSAKSDTYTASELKFARKFARGLKAKHVIIKTNELNNSNFNKNPVNRCYFCKKELFRKLSLLARKYNARWIADGSNIDDLGDFRPGRFAAKEYKVRSPLLEAGFSKDDIRQASKWLRLGTWDSPSLACLASRFPYKTKITRLALRKIDQAEGSLRKLGFTQVRVRHHGRLVRIEIPKDELPRLLNLDQRKIISNFKKLGYNYVTVDLEGYRTGSMNEVLKK